MVVLFWRSEAEIQEMTRRTRKGRHRLGGGESEEEEEEEEEEAAS